MKLNVPLIAAHFRLSPERWFANCYRLHIWLLLAWPDCIKSFINGDYEWVGSALGEWWGRRIWFPSVLGHPSQIDFDRRFRLTEQVINGLKHGSVDWRSCCIVCCSRPRLVIDGVYAQVSGLIIFDLLLIFLSTGRKDSWSLIESLRVSRRA